MCIIRTVKLLKISYCLSHLVCQLALINIFLVASVDHDHPCILLLMVPFYFKVSLTKIYNFSRESLSKYLMDTIDFNKNDINLFINETWQQ